MKKRISLVAVLGLLLVILLYFLNKNHDASFTADEKFIDNLITRLHSYNRQYSLEENWIVKESKEVKNNLYLINIASVDLDTIKTSGLFYDRIRDSFDIQYFEKRFSKDNYDYYIEFKKDTIYFYRQDSSGIKDFYIGKYNFLYKSGQMDYEEFAYYRANMDSLGKVRGNDTPKLPVVKN